MSYSITFNKTQSDDYTDPVHQDRITDSVWFTRMSSENNTYNGGPLFNYKYYVDNETTVTKNMLNNDFWYDGEGATGGTKGVLWGILSDDGLTGLPGLNTSLFSTLGNPSSFYSFSQMCVLLTSFVNSSSPPVSLVDSNNANEWNLENGDTSDGTEMPLLEDKDLVCYIPAVNQYFKIIISYWGIGDNGNAGAITYTRTPLFSASNICFVEDTLIKVDQGIVAIQHIDVNVHTIKRKKIIAITRSISNDTHLVKFEKHSLFRNCPNNVTIMSQHHKIMWNDKLIFAANFLPKYEGVTRIPYKKEILYNILMEDYETVIVNNMVCETLHPTNPIAKLYKTRLDL